MSRYSDARAVRSVIIHHSIFDPPSISTVIDRKRAINVDEIVDSLVFAKDIFSDYSENMSFANTLARIVTVYFLESFCYLHLKVNKHQHGYKRKRRL